jgi:hypothetical protein
MTKAAPRKPRGSRRKREPTCEPTGKLLDEVVSLSRRHIVLPDGAADAIALWVAHTHVIDAAQISPRLLVRSPEKQSGKTSLMTILEHFVRQPHAVSNITGPGIFRR